MHMVVRLHNEVSQEIRDREAMAHDQLVKSREQVTKAEAEIQQMKTEQEAIVNEKTKDFDDKR